MALVKYFTNKDSDKYKQCDYLQYNYDTHQKVVNTYIQRSPSKPYYAESDQVVQQSRMNACSNDSSQVSPYLKRGMIGTNSDSESPTKVSNNMNDQIYYCIKDPKVIPINLDKTVYSSSGSASSDQNT